MSLESESLPLAGHEATSNHSSPNFSDFGIQGKVLKGIKEAGFESPSPVQLEAIPHVLTGGDLVAQAQTGSGKTGAFVIPALTSLHYNKSVEVLVLVPTRELSQQVVQEFERLGKHLSINVVSIVGGQSAYRQIEMVNRGAQVVVATPGRLLDHLSSKKLKNFKPRMVVFDEADEMLDMGFIDDIRKILSFLPKKRQSLLFSATMPAPIARLADEELEEPKHIKLVTQGDPHEDIEQLVYLVRQAEREHALIRLLDAEKPEKAVIFCRTKRETIDLCERLSRRGLFVLALHGDLSQNERTRTISEIKRGHAKILVATDVASRGLDIQDLSHVINYNPAESKDRYTHRIGRTGRAGQKGKAISIVTPSELGTLYYLKNKQKNNVVYANLPTRTEVQKNSNAAFVEELQALTIHDGIREICDQLIPEEASRDFMMRLYTYISKSQKIMGPERIGLEEAEVKHLLEDRRPSGGSSRFSGGRRPQGGKPAGRGRSQGGRGHRGKGGPKSGAGRGGSQPKHAKPGGQNHDRSRGKGSDYANATY